MKRALVLKTCCRWVRSGNNNFTRVTVWSRRERKPTVFDPLSFSFRRNLDRLFRTRHFEEGFRGFRSSKVREMKRLFLVLWVLSLQRSPDPLFRSRRLEEGLCRSQSYAVMKMKHKFRSSGFFLPLIFDFPLLVSRTVTMEISAMDFADVSIEASFVLDRLEGSNFGFYVLLVKGKERLMGSALLFSC
ncbi:unnamed protein product [Linum trigynum]|uniref:Uncharacterized protein n=1 Tax=Linum trigynum TaxID=586398 RepID=A0AAV2D0W1_9ROSI